MRWLRSPWLRVAGAVLAGNALEYAAYRLSAGVLVPWLWAGRRAAGADVFQQPGLVAVTAVLFAAPPVLLGALGAWLARREQLWVGLASGLWGLSLIGWVPAAFPIASGVWYTPAVLVLLSSALGGWMMDLRAQAAAFRSG